jgi:hypothetical protein
MISLLCLAGIQAGSSVSFLKWLSALVAQGVYEPAEISLLCICGVIAVSSSLLQIFFLNTAIA